MACQQSTVIYEYLNIGGKKVLDTYCNTVCTVCINGHQAANDWVYTIYVQVPSTGLSASLMLHLPGATKRIMFSYRKADKLLVCWSTFYNLAFIFISTLNELNGHYLIVITVVISTKASRVWGSNPEPFSVNQEERHSSLWNRASQCLQIILWSYPTLRNQYLLLVSHKYSS